MAIGLGVLGCSNMTAGPVAQATYSVTYLGNSNTGGAVPSNQTKIQGTALTLAAKDGLWSDPTTWSCGSVPGAGTNVTIGAGITVTLDTNTVVLGTLTILGTLTVSGAQIITLAGTFTNNGTFNPGTGYVLSAPGTPGAPSTATFMEAGVKFVFPAGLPQNSLSLRQAPLASISDNFMMYSFRTTVVNQYYLIRSTASITGAFTLVIDYSAIMTSLTTSQINAVAFKSRQDSGSPWTDITLSGATITNRYTDGVKGKFTIEWSWPSCFNF